MGHRLWSVEAASERSTGPRTRCQVTDVHVDISNSRVQVDSRRPSEDAILPFELEEGLLSLVLDSADVKVVVCLTCKIP